MTTTVTTTEPAEWVNPFPRLDDVVQLDDVAKKGGTGFQADYVNWARISHYLRVHAPGWQPVMERDQDGRPFHSAPDGSIYLLIGFRHPDPDIPDTEPVVHAVMDNKNNAKKADNVDARDISDAYVRGMCKAAALLFGLGWKLWSKDDPMARGDKGGKGKGKGRTYPDLPKEVSEPAKTNGEVNRTKTGALVTIGLGDPPAKTTFEDCDIWIDYDVTPARVLRADGSGNFDELMDSDPPYTAAHETVANMLKAQAKEDKVSQPDLFDMLQEADKAECPASRLSQVSVGTLARVLNEQKELPA